MTEIEQFKYGGVGKLVEFNRLSDMTELQQDEYAEVALRIRLDGNGRTSHAKIGEALNVSTNMAKKLVHQGFMAMNVADPETVSYLRNKQVARYESLLDAWWGRAHQDTEAAEVAIRLMASINAVVGLEAAQKVELKGSIELHQTPQETINALIADIGSRAVEIVVEPEDQ